MKYRDIFLNVLEVFINVIVIESFFCCFNNVSIPNLNGTKLVSKVDSEIVVYDDENCDHD